MTRQLCLLPFWDIHLKINLWRLEFIECVPVA